MPSMLKPSRPIELFYVYADKDKSKYKAFAKHLEPWQKKGFIAGWHEGLILPGRDEEQEITMHLNISQIIVFFVSPDFLASDRFDNIIMRSMERHGRGDIHVIPIIVGSIAKQEEYFPGLRTLPGNGKPVSIWKNLDAAFANVATGILEVIEKVVEELAEEDTSSQPQRPDMPIKLWLEECDAHYRAKRYRKALASYVQATQFNPPPVHAYIGQGDLLLNHFKRYADSLKAYEQAIRLDTENAYAHYGRSLALRKLKRYDESLDACDQAIKIIPVSAMFHTTRGHLLHYLERYEDMQNAYDQSIQLDPYFAAAWNGKGNALYYLRRYPEALAAYERAIKIDPYFDLPYSNKGYTLKKLGRSKEAEQAFKDAQNPRPAKGTNVVRMVAGEN